MDEKKRRVPHPTTGDMVDATVVGFEKEGNVSFLLKLSDGSECRVTLDVVDVVRIPGSWDPDGHPLYHIRFGTVMAVLESPDELKKPDSKT